MAVLGAMSIAMRENLMSLFIVKSIAEVFCALVFLSHCDGGRGNSGRLSQCHDNTTSSLGELRSSLKIEE